MPATQLQSPLLTSEEWRLLGELLSREVRNLPVELGHTDIRAARQTLHERLDKAEALLTKLRPLLEN